MRYVSITGPVPSAAERILELGSVGTVTIGSHPGCTLVLPELPPLAARVIPASNHMMLYLLPEGASFDALPPPYPLPQGGERVDRRPFSVGPYRIRFDRMPMCDGLDARLRTLAAADPRAALGCVSACLRTLLRDLPSVQQALRPGLDAVEAWARGESAVEALRGLEDPTFTFADATECDLARSAFDVVRHALALVDGEDVRGSRLVAAVVRVHSELPHEGWERRLGDLLDLVDAQRWPRRTPTQAEVFAAPAAVAVAWDSALDSVSDGGTEQSIAELLAAHARAERLGLDWSDPVQRALAERTVDEARIRTLLAGG